MRALSSGKLLCIDDERDSFVCLRITVTLVDGELMGKLGVTETVMIGLFCSISSKVVRSNYYRILLGKLALILLESLYLR